MFVGKVIGTVWSTVKWPQVQGLKLLVVRPYHLADLAQLASSSDGNRAPALGAPPAAAADSAPHPSGGPDCEAVVCVDLLDAGVGDDVIVAFGHAARVAAQSQNQDLLAKVPGARTPAASKAPKAPKAPKAVVPIDAAVVAIVDSIAVARPST